MDIGLTWVNKCHGAVHYRVRISIGEPEFCHLCFPVHTAALSVCVCVGGGGVSKGSYSYFQSLSGMRWGFTNKSLKSFKYICLERASKRLVQYMYIALPFNGLQNGAQSS